MNLVWAAAGISMEGTDTQYCSGDEIRAGDRVRCADWTGVVLFVLGNNSIAKGHSSADWGYLEQGFMVDYGAAGLIFQRCADEDLELLARA